MIGSRIKLARKRSGMSLRDLSTALDGKVSAQAIGKYERGEMVPSSGVLGAMSKALKVSIPYLLDSQGINLTGVDFRKHARTTAKDKAAVETAVLEMTERYLQVETILDLDSASWHSPLGYQKKRLSAQDFKQQAEDLANEVRQAWELGNDPIPNVTELLEEKGLKVLILDLPSNVSGFTCLVKWQGKGDVPVIVVNKNHSLERRRLTLLHELAHQLIDDSELTDKEAETAANRFAAAFLMPKHHVQTVVLNQSPLRQSLSHHEVMDLKKLYRVSAAAFVIRLKDVGILPENTVTYIFQTTGRTWRTEEPCPLEATGDSRLHERPYRFERLCYWALAEGLISSSKAAELLREPIDAVEMGLKGPGRDVPDCC
jgi:Zn-dependent peptidase ImmA (M78 family)